MVVAVKLTGEVGGLARLPAAAVVAGLPCSLRPLRMLAGVLLPHIHQRLCFGRDDVELLVEDSALATSSSLAASISSAASHSSC